MINIREYANNKGKSVQAVYKQMKSKENAVALEGHVFTQKLNNKNTKFLDETAVKILDEAGRQIPAIIRQTSDKERIEQLENEKRGLLLQVAELHEIIILRQEEVKPRGFWEKLRWLLGE